MRPDGRLLVIGYPERLADDHAALLTAAHEAGVTAELIAPSRLALVVGGTGGTGAVLLDGHPCTPAAVLPRGVNRAWPLLRQMFEVWVDAGVRLVPGIAAIDTCADKVLTARLLAAAGVPVLPTVAVVAGEGVTPEVLDATGVLGAGPTVVKPARGSKARGVERHPTPADAAASLHGGRALIDKMVDHQVVQPLATDAGTDHRVVVARGRVVAVTRRTVRDGGFITNRGEVEMTDVDPAGGSGAEVARVALAAAEVLHLEFGGVDVIVHEGHAAVLEANAWPGLAPAVHGTRLARALVEAALA